MASAAILTGIAISLTGRYRWAVWNGWLLTTLGMGLLCLFDVKTSVPAWVFINLVLGIGLGILIPAESTAIHAATESADAAFAISMYTLLRANGQTFGVAIGGTIFQTRLGDILSSGSDLGDRAAVERLLRLLRKTQEGTGHLNEIGEAELKKMIGRALRAVVGIQLSVCKVGGDFSYMDGRVELGQEEIRTRFDL